MSQFDQYSLAGCLNDENYTGPKLQSLGGSDPLGTSGAAYQHGNHSMVVVGYDLEQKMYLVRNSWGEGWAKGGYFQMPMALFHERTRVRQNWAIGSLGSAPGLSLLGAGVPAAAASMAKAAVQAPSLLSGDPGKALRDEVQGQIDSARSGFANRLRGGN